MCIKQTPHKPVLAAAVIFFSEPSVLSSSGAVSQSNHPKLRDINLDKSIENFIF